MKLSIVSTLYNSEPHISEFHARASKAAREVVGDEYEIVLVNDGSPDDSLDAALALGASDPHVVVVDLSRNFGHHKAMMTGLAHSLGDHVFLIDSDLEEEPEWLSSFWSDLQRLECDVVYGVQTTRKGAFVERWSGNLFYWAVNTMTGLDLPKNVVTARLMTRRYVEALVQHQEREVFIAGLWATTGFRQHASSVKKLSRSRTTYSPRKKISVIVNSITSFSRFPLTIIFYTGFSISLFSFFYIMYIVINRIFFATPLSGWTSLMASIWFLGGMVILFMGVIGIYLSKIFSEVKGRPYTIVRQIYGRK